MLLLDTAYKYLPKGASMKVVEFVNWVIPLDYTIKI